MTATATTTLYVGNSNNLEVNGLKNEATGVFVNDATVTATLTDASGDNLTGETWPKSLPYVASSNGIYRASLAVGLNLTAGRKVIAKITAVSGGLTYYVEKQLTAKART